MELVHEFCGGTSFYGPFLLLPTQLYYNYPLAAPYTSPKNNTTLVSFGSALSHILLVTFLLENLASLEDKICAKMSNGDVVTPKHPVQNLVQVQFQYRFRTYRGYLPIRQLCN